MKIIQYCPIIFIFFLSLALAPVSHALSPDQVQAIHSSLEKFVKSNVSSNNLSAQSLVLFLQTNSTLKNIIQSDEIPTPLELIETIRTAPILNQAHIELNDLTPENVELALISLQIQNGIIKSNENRFAVIEFTSLLYDVYSAILPSPEQVAQIEEENRKQSIEFENTLIKLNQETIKSYKEFIRDYESKIAELKKEQNNNSTSSIQKEGKSKSARDRLQAKIKQRDEEKSNALWYGSQISFYEEQLQFYLNQTKELIRRNIESQQRINALNSKTSEKGPSTQEALPKPKSNVALPFLNLFKPITNLDELEQTFKSVGAGFFLTEAEFQTFDHETLLNQYQICQDAYLRMQSTMPSTEAELEAFQKQTSTPVDKTNLTGLVAYTQSLTKIHELELKRRELEKRLSEQRTAIPDLSLVQVDESPTPNEILIPETLIQGPLPEGNTPSVLNPNVNPPEKDTARDQSPITIPAGQKTNTKELPAGQKEEIETSRWNVEVKKLVKKIAEKELTTQSRSDLAALVQHLEQEGPILDPQVASTHRWRNFSKLSSKDYHCHLGSSNLVVVWRVLDPSKNIISIYYLGTHPTTYKRILKTAPGLSF